MASHPSEAIVGPELGGGAVDGIVRALFGLSWGRARELIRRGKIRVDERVVASPTERVRAGARVVLDLGARDPRAARAELPRSALVHVDAHLVVVEKPAFVSTVPFEDGNTDRRAGPRARRSEESTLDERVRAALAARERARGRGGPPPDVGVVHRLDKETTGLVVFTRTKAAKEALTHAFRTHQVHRRYLGLVHGVPKSETIVSHFVPDRGDGLRGSVERRHGRAYAVGSERTQRAVTHVEVVEALAESTPPCALVACRLETGRTHQIRIHLSEAGHPLVGERAYARGYAGALVPAPRIMLHAAELGFEHPATGEAMRWTSELPADMREVLTQLRGQR